MNLLGSKIDGFLRQVLVVSGQMMFENMCQLYFAYVHYLDERPYNYMYSTQLLESSVSTKLQNLETELMTKSSEDIELADLPESFNA